MSQVDSLSVFFPVYNEEKNIEDTVKKAQKILPTVAKKWEILVINDGSTDKTEEIIKGLIVNDKRIRMITHVSNRGYGAALKSGFNNSSYPLIVFTDADGQFDLSEITKFFRKKEETGAKLVVGYYLKRAVSVYRKLGSFIWELMVFSLFGLRLKDIDCGFKLIEKEVIDKIGKLEAERGPFITSEFLIKAKKAGFKIAQVDVHHFPRQGGRPTGASLKVILSGFSDLVKLRNKLKET